MGVFLVQSEAQETIDQNQKLGLKGTHEVEHSGCLEEFQHLIDLGLNASAPVDVQNLGEEVVVGPDLLFDVVEDHRVIGL